MWEDDEGTCHGRFRIPALHGQMLQQDDPRDQLTVALHQRQPRPVGSGIDPDLPTPVRHGIALTQLIETYPAEKLPKTGGCSATVVVTMTLEQLLADLDHAGVCTLDTGGRITAAEARRLACTAGIIPVVLGGKSQVLDVGRKRRLHTETMRIAMGVRDGGCTAQGCETPPGLCHAHHDTPWSARRSDQRRTPVASSARTITGGCTTRSTRPDTCLAARSPSTGGRRKRPRSRHAAGAATTHAQPARSPAHR